MSITLNKTTRKKKRVEKQCQFPISDTEVCGTTFYGIGPSKYCDEHRKLKYRKFINRKLAADKKAIEIPTEDANQIIKHKYQEATIRRCQCAIEGCTEEFDVTLYPRTYVYPKFCPQHRNEHKRNMFRQRTVIINQ